MGVWDTLGAINALLMAIAILYLQYEVCLQPILSQNRTDHVLDMHLEEANRDVGERALCPSPGEEPYYFIINWLD